MFYTNSGIIFIIHDLSNILILVSQHGLNQTYKYVLYFLVQRCIFFKNIQQEVSFKTQNVIKQLNSENFLFSAAKHYKTTTFAFATVKEEGNCIGGG